MKRTNFFPFLDKIISSELGIVSRLIELPRHHKDPKLFQYNGTLCDSYPLTGIPFEQGSGGCGFTREAGIMAAIGESIERYCCQFWFEDDLKKASYKDIKSQAIDPNAFALFHENQFKQARFPYKPFTEDLKIHWSHCHDLISNKDVLYPAQLIYMPFNQDPENQISMQVSTGMSAHTDIYRSILLSLCEVIERDAFTITWLQGLDIPKIELTDEIKRLANRVFADDYEYHLFDMTLDINVPSVMGLLFGESDFGKFMLVSAATRPTYKEAIEKTLLEMGQGVPYCRFLVVEKKYWLPSETYDDILSFDDHVGLYLKRPDLWHVFDKWRYKKPSKKVDLSNPEKNDKDRIKAILSLLKAKGYHAVLKDLTTVDARSLGFYCIKVCIPELLPLSGIYKYYYLGGKRLYEAPKRLGYESHDIEGLNKFPHPFP